MRLKVYREYPSYLDFQTKKKKSTIGFLKYLKEGL